MKSRIDSTTPIGGIQEGHSGDAAPLFFNKSGVALGPHSMGELSNPKHKPFHV